MAITLADFNKIWASTSPLTPYSFSEANYKQGWNFIGSTPPARQMWDFLQKNNDEKMQYLANNYLPLSGGTMTGEIIQSQSSAMRRSVDDSILRIFGGTAWNKGSYISLYGKDHTAQPGWFELIAHNGTASKVFQGKPDGTLTWDGNNVITSAGGTMTTTLGMGRDVDNGQLVFRGGTSTSKGAYLQIVGKDSSDSPGEFFLVAHDGTNHPYIQGKPDGTLKWNGQTIQTSSDRRLKQDFANIPADVLEAWGKVEWQQFKYKADAEKKGAENCRWHTGLVAQDVAEVGEENNVNFLQYGILCHDVRDAVEEETDENGNVITVARDAEDLWTVRYTEALCMEVAYLRKKIAELEARLGAE